MEIVELNLSRIKHGFPGVSPGLGTAHLEACLVCLENQHHSSGVILTVKGDTETKFRLQWEEKVTPQMQRAWRDLQVTTEIAACGIAFLLVEVLTEYTVASRSAKTTGYDYALAEKSAVSNDDIVIYQQARLEVSGILSAESEGIISARVTQKTKQTDVSDNSELPAFIVVVEFSRPLAYMVKK
jgi:hypothetical protein